jgi:hypothetical protein
MPARRYRIAGALVALLAAAGGGSLHAQAGTVGPVVPITLSAVQPGVLTVTVQSGGIQSIPSLTSNAINPFPSPIQIYTQWNLRPNSGSSLSLVAWFALPARALSGPQDISSSRVEARMTTGAVPAFEPIDNSPVGGVGTAGGSLVLWTFPLCNSNFCRRNERTDPLDLRLNLTGLVLPPGLYAGTLYLRAITY